MLNNGWWVGFCIGTALSTGPEGAGRRAYGGGGHSGTLEEQRELYNGARQAGIRTTQQIMVYSQRFKMRINVSSHKRIY